MELEQIEAEHQKTVVEWAKWAIKRIEDYYKD